MNVFDMHNRGESLSKRQKLFIEGYAYHSEQEELRRLEAHYYGAVNAYKKWGHITKQEQEEIAWHIFLNPFDYR